MPLPREEDGSLDYNMMQYYWDKHGDLSNYGDPLDILKELGASTDQRLYMSYSNFLRSRSECTNLLMNGYMLGGNDE